MHHPSWVCLCPIAFRTLEGNEQFKYQIVKLPIRARGSSDPRPESFSPDMSQIMVGEVVPSTRNWARRQELISPLIGATTTCELIAINRATPMNRPAPSLGLIEPVVTRIEPLPYKGWTAAQYRKVQRASEPDLFNAPLAELSLFHTDSAFTTSVSKLDAMATSRRS